MNDEVSKLNLDRFKDPAMALELARAGCPHVYTEIAREHFRVSGDLWPNSLLFLSCVTRARGLHEGCLREIEAENPHAVFPLIRALAELVSIVFYCLQNPKYPSRLTGIGPEANKGPVKFSQIFSAINADLPGMKAAYSELSAFTHFERTGVYNVHVVSDVEGRTIQWSDAPKWRNETDFQIACAQLEELAIAIQAGLRRFSIELIPGE